MIERGDGHWGEPDYAAAPEPATDTQGIALRAHAPDDEGVCMWCGIPYPCERSRTAKNPDPISRG